MADMSISDSIGTDSSGSTLGTEATEPTIMINGQPRAVSAGPQISLHGPSNSGPMSTALAPPLFSIPERGRGRSLTRDGSDGQVSWRDFASPSARRRPKSARSARSPSPRATVHMGTVDDARSVISDASDSAHVPARSTQPRVDDGACTLQSRVRVRPPELKAKGGSTGWSRLARIAGGLLGALAGAAVGFGIGSMVGGQVTLPTVVGIPFGAVGGGLFGAVVGAVVGAGAGVVLADRLFGRPQKAHLDAAVNAIQRSLGREFDQKQVDRLEAVADWQWRTLLHVPSSKGRYMPQTPWGARRVKGSGPRQKIRQALVREVADSGLEAAKNSKAQEIQKVLLDERPS
jgi:hypothetical protein